MEDELKKLGDVDFEYIHLKDLDIKPCKGCFVCFIKGEDYCPLDDDKEKISIKIAEADGVIFVSPVYSMHVSYLMKKFIDRFAYNFHRPRYFGKYAVTLAVTGGIGLEETLKYLKMITVCWGFQFVDQLDFIAPPRNTPIRPLMKKKDRTEEVAIKFYKAMKERKPRKLTFSDYLMFRSMQAVYSRMETMSPADYKYWNEKGWLEKDVEYFYTNVRGSFFKDIIARFMAWMTGRKIDKSMVR